VGAAGDSHPQRIAAHPGDPSGRSRSRKSRHWNGTSMISPGASFKLEVSSMEQPRPVARRPASSFTLETSHPAEGRFCKTEPIRRSGSSYLVARVSRRCLCETKPIRKRSGGDAQPTRRRFCETKPNLGYVGKGSRRAGAAPRESEMRQTKPIRVRQGWLSGDLCETKPNLGELGRVGIAGGPRLGVKCVKRTQFGVGWAACQADYAKRTQFRGSGRGQCIRRDAGG
jgi:hypothetical protein